jgi:hypothetical protein
VSRANFLFGVLAFRDRTQALPLVQRTPRVQQDLDAITEEIENLPEDADQLLGLLGSLDYQQQQSLLTYWKIPEDGTFIDDTRLRSKWTHLRSMTQAQLMILAICALAAITQ